MLGARRGIVPFALAVRTADSPSASLHFLSLLLFSSIRIPAGAASRYARKLPMLGARMKPFSSQLRFLQ
jgi:hypothetical protein